MRKRLLFVVNHAGFFVSHRLPIAVAAIGAGFEVHVASAAGAAVAVMQARGITHHELNLSRNGINPLHELLAFLEIRRLMRRLRPDIVHLVTSKPVLYGGIAARLIGVPAVVAAISGLGHVFTANDLPTRLVRLLVSAGYRIALKQANLKVIFQNPSDRDLLVRSGAVAPASAVLIKGSGVDLQEYRATPEPQEPLVVTYAARLLKTKGVCEFVEAAKQLRLRQVRARFLLVGDVDPDNSASVTCGDIERWKADGWVEVLGLRREIAAIFAASHLVVFPSYYGEGLPKVLVEAAACGRAVITTDIPGCRDAMVQEETGLLVPAHDVAALARAIEALLSDRGRRQRMGAAGRALAEREYAIERIVGRHLQIYRSLLSA